jgi:hypothetical protein
VSWKPYCKDPEWNFFAHAADDWKWSQDVGQSVWISVDFGGLWSLSWLQNIARKNALSGSASIVNWMKGLLWLHWAMRPLHKCHQITGDTAMASVVPNQEPLSHNAPSRCSSLSFRSVHALSCSCCIFFCYFLSRKADLRYLYNCTYSETDYPVTDADPFWVAQQNMFFSHLRMEADPVSEMFSCF